MSVDVTSDSGTSSGKSNVELARDIGLIGLLWASMGSIIGSGWLFGAQKGLFNAGPAVMISWVIGGLCILVLALVHAELGAMYPALGRHPLASRTTPSAASPERGSAGSPGSRP